MARALRATHVLDGSVRRSGSKVRIAANLIECADETTLWSERFDRELSDVFALQDEIAAAVAAALKVAFAPAAPAETIDPAAFTLYLKARDIRNRGLLSPATVIEVTKLPGARRPGLAPRVRSRLGVPGQHAGGAAALRRWTDAPDHQARRRCGSGRDGAEARPRAGRRVPSAPGTLEPFGQFADREAIAREGAGGSPQRPDCAY